MLLKANNLIRASPPALPAFGRVLPASGKGQKASCPVSAGPGRRRSGSSDKSVPGRVKARDPDRERVADDGDWQAHRAVNPGGTLCDWRHGRPCSRQPMSQESIGWV